MIEILNPHLDRRGKRGGKSKLSGEDRLLVVLEYWREYRTQFHIGTSWNICESAVCRLICKVEKLLMDSGKFRLPGKKQLDRQADNWQVIVVDVTESPIERPKKSGCIRLWRGFALRAEVSSACVAPSSRRPTIVGRKSTTP